MDKSFSMKKKLDAHEGISILSQRDGVPPILITDGSKEQILGKFWQKC
jgi:hypothetical protein